MARSERQEFLTLIGELKQRVEALEKAQGVDVSGLVERVEKLEAKRGPGRPPKQAD
jgi:hypothetical protein